MYVFGNDKHPGTRGFNMLIKSYMKELHKGSCKGGSIKKFDSDVYRTLKERVPSTSRYYTRHRDSGSEDEDEDDDKKSSSSSPSRQWEEVTEKG